MQPETGVSSRRQPGPSTCPFIPGPGTYSLTYPCTQSKVFLSFLNQKRQVHGHSLNQTPSARCLHTCLDTHELAPAWLTCQTLTYMFTNSLGHPHINSLRHLVTVGDDPFSAINKVKVVHVLSQPLKCIASRPFG